MGWLVWALEDKRICGDAGSSSPQRSSTIFRKVTLGMNAAHWFLPQMGLHPSLLSKMAVISTEVSSTHMGKEETKPALCPKPYAVFSQIQHAPFSPQKVQLLRNVLESRIYGNNSFCLCRGMQK